VASDAARGEGAGRWVGEARGTEGRIDHRRGDRRRLRARARSAVERLL